MEENKKVSAYTLIVCMIITACLVYITTTTIYYNKHEELLLEYYSEPQTYSGDFSKLKKVMGIIEDEYLNEYDTKELEEGAIRGMLEALGDPYTTYFDKEETESFFINVEGEYEGVGMYIALDIEKNTVIVISPIEDSPADKAGVKPGDYIIGINGQNMVGASSEEISSLLKGTAGTKVDVKFLRYDEDGKENTYEVTLERKKIEVNSFKYDVINGNIGYIEFSSFDENASGYFDKAIKDLIENKKVEGLIIDLRDNPGGILDSAVYIADRLLPKGRIVYTVDKNGKQNVWYSDNKCVDIPIVVLMNENSASASEILASAIKDYGGIIVGKTSFGKGVVQEMKNLKDGTYMKITISEYFSPNGNKINEIGVKPEIEVEDDAKTKEDEQLEKAIQVLTEKINKNI